MANLSYKFEDLVITDEALVELNDELSVSVAEFGSVSWGDFEGGVVSRNGTGYNLSFPNSRRNWTNRNEFISLLSSKITSGSALIEFIGTTLKEGGDVYQILSDDTNVEVYKFEYKPVLFQQTPIITNPIYSSVVVPLSFDTTLNAGDSAVDNVSLAGAGSVEFNNLNLNEDPITDNESANIRVDGVDVAQLDFTTGYLGQPFRYTKDGIDYTGVINATAINVVEEA